MAKHAGGRPRKLSTEQENKVVQEYKAGTFLYEIAYKFKISEKTFYRILNRHCVK